MRYFNFKSYKRHIYISLHLRGSANMVFVRQHKHTKMKGQSEIASLPKFANMMLIVVVIVITKILYIILIFDCFENQ